MPVSRLRHRTRCLHCSTTGRFSPTEFGICRADRGPRAMTWTTLYLCGSCTDALQQLVSGPMNPSSSPDLGEPAPTEAMRRDRSRFQQWRHSPWNQLPDH
jgi:hypothetical protein